MYARYCGGDQQAVTQVTFYFRIVEGLHAGDKFSEDQYLVFSVKTPRGGSPGIHRTNSINQLM
jgi:hypothetical protein